MTGVDWWALGILIYECLQGHTPFAATSALQGGHSQVYGRIMAYAAAEPADVEAALAWRDGVPSQPPSDHCVYHLCVSHVCIMHETDGGVHSPLSRPNAWPTHPPGVGESAKVLVGSLLTPEPRQRLGCAAVIDSGTTEAELPSQGSCPGDVQGSTWFSELDWAGLEAGTLHAPCVWQPIHSQPCRRSLSRERG
jgi:serine/threonine protein kinase